LLIEKLGSTRWYPRTNYGKRTHSCRPWDMEAKEKRCANLISIIFLSFPPFYYPSLYMWYFVRFRSYLLYQ